MIVGSRGRGKVCLSKCGQPQSGSANVRAVNFSGLFVPVSSLSGGARLFGLGFPAAWYQQISIGTFTKGLGFAELWVNHLALAVFAVLFVAASILLLNKQEA